MDKHKIEVIYELVADMTIKRIEKETKLSGLTLKMISLTERLFQAVLCSR